MSGGVVPSGKVRRVLRARHPDEPWRWREDWEQGVIPASREGGPGTAWLIALLVLAIGVTFAVLAWDKLVGDGPSPVWFVFLFPLLGVHLALRAAVVTARALKYGRPALRLAGAPCVLGGSVQGTVEFRRGRFPQVHHVELELQQRVTRERGTSSSKEILTEIFWSLRVPAAIQAGASAIPVSLPIPADGNPTGGDELPATSWRLRIQAETAGPDLDAVFDLPVRDGGDGGDPAQTKDAIDAAQTEAVMGGGEKALIDSLGREGIRLSRHAAGLDLRVRPIGLRRGGFAIAALVFAALPVLYWIFLLSGQSGAGRWAGFVPLATLGATVLCLTMAKSYHVRAGRQGLRVVRRILGVPSSWQIRHEDIASLEAHSSMSSSSANQRVSYYDLVLKWRWRAKVTRVRIALGITEKALATALAEALRQGGA